MDVWELVAREEIRELVARYAHCADSGRFEELVALFAEDGVLEIVGREELHGRQAILNFLVVGEHGPDHWGRYRDRYAQRDGRWLFARRQVRVDGRAGLRDRAS